MGWGDEVIAAGEAEKIYKQRRKRVMIMDARERPRWHSAWIGNPVIARPGAARSQCVQLLNCGWHRPYCKGYTGTQWIWNYDFRVSPAKLYLTAKEEEFGRAHSYRVVIEPNNKPKAPPNKQWGWDKWGELVRRSPVKLTQLGTPGCRVLDGVEFIPTTDIRMAAAVLAHARAAVLPEGGLHHIAAAFNKPAVVIFGGYIHPAITGYDMHQNIFSSDHACGMRVECGHCKIAMGRIDPEEVLTKLKGIL